MASKLWHPHAERVPLSNAGPFVHGVADIGVLHTTEGSAPFSPSLYHGTQPQFTLDVKRKKLYQHIPTNRSGMALENRSGGVETNHEDCIQAEIIGFTFKAAPGHDPKFEVRNWTKADIEFIAEWMRWVEWATDIPRSASVSFSHPVRMSYAQWTSYKGWCGHVHVPENAHVDGTGMPVKSLLAGGEVQKAPEPNLRRGATGAGVHHLQALLRAAGIKVEVDGVFGPGTERAVKRAQALAKLEQSGVCGSKTWKAIHRLVKERRN